MDSGEVLFWDELWGCLGGEVRGNGLGHTPLVLLIDLL